jgi:hypothetical protein
MINVVNMSLNKDRIVDIWRKRLEMNIYSDSYMATDSQNKIEKNFIDLSYFRRYTRYLYELIENIEKVMNSKRHLIGNAEERNVYDKTMKLKFYSI